MQQGYRIGELEHTCPLPRADFPATGRGIHPLVCRVSA